MENNKPANNEIQIELSEEMAQGTYANLAIICLLYTSDAADE